MNIEDVKNCDLYKPNFILAIRDIPDNFSWYAWFRERNLKGMVYAFYYKNDLLKIGCSFCNFQTRKNTNYGDRLIRQINNLPGRFKLNLDDYYKEGYGFLPASPNGKEIVDTIIEFENTKGIKIDQTEIYLHIWNITETEAQAYYFGDSDKNNKRKAEYFEGLLVEQYKRDNNQKLPPGNKKDPSTQNHAYTKPKISKEAGNLFFSS
jgi:hypothetical protein